jgi:hypothetical protein
MAFYQSCKLLGIDVVDAYVKISYLNLSKDNMMATLVWKAKPDSPTLKTNSYSLKYDINGENPLRQAYLQLKDNPHFEGVKDC